MKNTEYNLQLKSKRIHDQNDREKHTHNRTIKTNKINLYLFSAKKSSNRKLLQKSNDISSSLHLQK